LVVELKEKESSLDLESYSKNDKRKKIIDVEPTSTIMPIIIQLEELEDFEEGITSSIYRCG
jgi:hypothetical protein